METSVVPSAEAPLHFTQLFIDWAVEGRVLLKFLVVLMIDYVYVEVRDNSISGMVVWCAQLYVRSCAVPAFVVGACFFLSRPFYYSNAKQAPHCEISPWTWCSQVD